MVQLLKDDKTLNDKTIQVMDHFNSEERQGTRGHENK